MKNRDYNNVDLSIFENVNDVLYWKYRPLSHFKTKKSFSIWNAKYAGKEAGNEFVSSKSKTKYKRVTINNEQFLCHRIIWIMHNGKIPSNMEIDHIDGNGLNNNINNLRLVSLSENRKNMPMQSNNSSGQVGVRFNKRQNKWVARIQIDKKEKFIGYFNSFDEAKNARKKAEKEYNFCQNHGRNYKDKVQDLKEALASISRAIELESDNVEA